MPKPSPLKVSLATIAPALPHLDELKSMVSAQVQALFNAQAMVLKNSLQAMLDSQVRRGLQVFPGENAEMLIQEAMDYIDKAHRLADRLSIYNSPVPVNWELIFGNGAWFMPSAPCEPLIPVNRVFDRITTATALTVAEVECALDRLSFSATEAVAMGPNMEDLPLLPLAVAATTPASVAAAAGATTLGTEAPTLDDAAEEALW